jgi:hypothetical protein
VLRLARVRSARRGASCVALALLAVLAVGCGSSAPASGVSHSGADTFLAVGGDITNGPLLYEPACGGYTCRLSGDATAWLYHMTWTTWSATQAVGTGTYKLNDCNPGCAVGTIYPIPAVVTLSQPAQVCFGSVTRRVWTRVSFRFPDGLPKAFQGQNAPQNPWTFVPLTGGTQPSCT